MTPSGPSLTPAQVRGYHQALQTGVPQVINVLASAYQQACDIPLAAYDAKFRGKVSSCEGQITGLKQYACRLDQQGIRFVDDTANYLSALLMIQALPAHMLQQLGQQGMTMRLAQHYRSSLLRAARYLSPSFATALEASLPLYSASRTLAPATATRAQFEGAIVGVALGDALGAPFEFHPPDAQISFAEICAQSPRLRGTDDTLTTRAVLTSVLKRQAVVPRDVGLQLAQLAPQIGLGGFGHATRNAVRQLARGLDWRSVGSPEALGNGAAMRVAPVALLAYRDLERLRQWVTLSSCITHPNYEALSGALAIAFLLASIFRQEYDISNIAAMIATTRRFIGPGIFSAKLAQLPSLLTQQSADPVAILRSLGTSGVVTESVVSALYVFCAFPENYQRMMETIIRAGGDTDTIASIASSLFGAQHGVAAFPSDQVDRLEDGPAITAQAAALWTMLHC